MENNKDKECLYKLIDTINALLNDPIRARDINKDPGKFVLVEDYNSEGEITVLFNFNQGSKVQTIIKKWYSLPELPYNQLLREMVRYMMWGKTVNLGYGTMHNFNDLVIKGIAEDYGK